MSSGQCNNAMDTLTDEHRAPNYSRLFSIVRRRRHFEKPGIVPFNSALDRVRSDRLQRGMVWNLNPVFPLGDQRLGYPSDFGEISLRHLEDVGADMLHGAHGILNMPNGMFCQYARRNFLHADRHVWCTA